MTQETETLMLRILQNIQAGQKDIINKLAIVESRIATVENRLTLIDQRIDNDFVSYSSLGERINRIENRLEISDKG